MQEKIFLAVLLYFVFMTGPAFAQTHSGETVFQTYCAECHLKPVSEEIPTVDALSGYEPEWRWTDLWCSR